MEIRPKVSLIGISTWHESTTSAVLEFGCSCFLLQDMPSRPHNTQCMYCGGAEGVCGGGGGSGSEWGFVEAGLECVLRGLRSMWVGVMGMCKDKLKVNCISNNMLHMFSAEVLQWVYLLT